MLAPMLLLTLFLTNADEKYLDFPLLPGSIALEEPGRFESPRTYKQTLHFYKYFVRNEAGVRWRNIVNLPQIKARHIESTNKKSLWSGANVYEHKGRVRVYVIPRDPAAKEVNKRPR